MEGENNEFLRYVQVRFMKYPQNNKQKKWNEKAQGIVEYALILAFIVGIAAAIFAKGGLAEAVSDAYFQISKTIAYAMDNTKEGHQRFAQSQLEQGLKSAIQNKKIRLESEGAWVEIDLQSDLNDKIKAKADGGKGGNVTVNGITYGPSTGYFTGLWDATGLDPSRVHLDEADLGNWAGVRIEKSGDAYKVYYFNGNTSKVQDETKVGGTNHYTDTNYMQEYFGNGQAPAIWKP